MYPGSERHQIGWAHRSVGGQNRRRRLLNKLPSPIVVPACRWKLDVIIIEFVRIGRGCYEYVRAEKKLSSCLTIDVQRMMVACGVGKFKKERPLDRHSRARCFFCERV